MPIKAAAFKALRQAKKHAERNKLAKLKLADARRAVRKTLDSAEVKKAEEAVKNAIKMLDKAYSRGIMKLNTVSRHKSRLMARLAKLEHEQKILEKDVLAIDLRIVDRVVVRLTEEAALARAEAVSGG